MRNAAPIVPSVPSVNSDFTYLFFFYKHVIFCFSIKQKENARTSLQWMFFQQIDLLKWPFYNLNCLPSFIFLIFFFFTLKMQINQDLKRIEKEWNLYFVASNQRDVSCKRFPSKWNRKFSAK